MQRFINTLCATALICSFGAANADGSDSPTIATVNGEVITELERDTHKAQFAARGQQAPDEAILDELISLELMRQEAVKQGLDKTPAMAAEMKIMRARVLANTLLTNFTDGIETTDETLKAEYDRQLANSKVFEFNARHILVEEEARAKEIITELDGGADFAEAAKKYSTGPSGENGGDLGWFDSGAMVPEFSKAAAELEVGKYSTAPVKTQFGYHIIKLEDKRAKEAQSFESVKEQLRGMMLREKIAEYVDGLHEAAKIEKPE